MKQPVKHGIVFFAFVAACGALLFSCSKEEVKQAECDILAAWVEGAEYEHLFFKASDMRVDNISSTTTEIVFTVQSVSALPTEMPLYLTLTEGATSTPASGEMQDFTQGPVTYTVTSEDGENQRRYTVAFRQPDTPVGSSYTYSFEGIDSTGLNDFAYNIFYEVGSDGERNYIWASGNEGVAILHPDWRPAQFPTRSTAEGYQGFGVSLTTQDAGALGRFMGKPIAAGNLFIGRFDVGQVILDPLKSTVFGTPVSQEPMTLRGYYKYTPGEVFTDAQSNPVEDRTDEANIYAVFFRNQDAEGQPIALYGNDVLSNPYIVKKALVASLPPTEEWATFEATFEGAEADAQVLAAMGYSMTLVFTSSKGGDDFEGAVGSTLCIDEVTVTFKNE